MHRHWISGLTLILLCAAAPAAAREAMDPVATADAFGAALAAGDEAAALKLLAPDVLIYESGGQEASREEYAAAHLKGDIEFLKGVRSQTLDRKHTVLGDLAVVTSRSRATGTYKDKPVDFLGTETLVLRRGKEGWRIAHIHWSSRPAPKENGPTPTR
jgi:ketosteroid isomerase-like protein